MSHDNTLGSFPSDANDENNRSRGGRPVSYDTEDCKNRNVIERAFNVVKKLARTRDHG